MTNFFLTAPVIWGLSAAGGVMAAVLAYRSVDLELLLRWVVLRVAVAVVFAVAVIGASVYTMTWIRDHPHAMVCACAINPSGFYGSTHG